MNNEIQNLNPAQESQRPIDTPDLDHPKTAQTTQSVEQSSGVVQNDHPVSQEIESSLAPEAQTPPTKLPQSSTPQRSMWPAIALSMLVVVGFVGWRVYRGIQTSTPVETTEVNNNQGQLPVRVARAQTGLAQSWVFDEGTSLPVELRVLNFYADGDITQVAQINGVQLREGDRVRQGQLLATVDDRRQSSSIDTADADIQVALNQRNQSEAALLQARADVAKAESDLALAETEFRRYQSLFEQGAVSESDRDVYRNRVDQAAAAYEIAQQAFRSTGDDVRVAESSIEVAQARRSQVVVDLEDTQLVSPIDGVIAYINIRQGEYWSSRYLDTSSPQSVIETAPIVVVDPSTYEVEMEIQANDADALRLGQRAYVVLEEAVSGAQANGATEQDLLEIARREGSEGRVFAVSPSQTPGGRGTRVTIRDLQQTSNLKVGARVYVWIETVANPDATLLPLGSVLARGQDFFAFVVNEADGTVEQRRVTRGVESSSGVEILSGVEPGEMVVIEGQNRLVDGTPVDIINREQVQ
ncbi:MAG: multidrug transporter [Cyanobacteria bacterium J06638_22]